MAPSKTKTAPHKSNNHKRYLADDATKDAGFMIDLNGNEAEGKELQAVRQSDDSDFEGFGSEVGEKNSQNEDEDSDAESVKINIQEKKSERVIPPKDAEEEELERLIFGDSAGFKDGLENFSIDRTAGMYRGASDEEQEEGSDLDNVADDNLFFFDTGPEAAPAGSVALAKAEESGDEEDQPAWDDSDDERLVVSLASVPQLRKLRETAEDDMVNGKEYARRLRKQYERLYPAPEWAAHATGKAKKRRRTMDDDEESDQESGSDMDVDDDLSTQPLARLLKDADILSRNAARGSARRRKLQAGTIDIQRLKDVSKAGPRTPLTTTAFHPSPSDSRIFLSARRRYFHVWNIATGQVEKVTRVYGHQHEQRTMEYFSLSPNGKYMALRGSSRKGGGVINILDTRTLQWATQVRIESRGGVADFAWWRSGNGMSIAGKNGEVTEWSVQDGVIGRWNDEGAVGTTVIALGGNSGRDDWIGGDRWVAIGSSSGVVNIYDRRAWSEDAEDAKLSSNGGIPKAPKPLRALGNLTTPTSHLTFSPDGQILAMASRWKNNAMRLVHLPTATVFKNWPTEKTPLGRITAVAWGRPTEEEEREGSLAQVAVANESGHIRLWEVRA
ncbi:hypothetical protein E8E12_004009 [Didymella heteroderae]|uniref:WD40 repeat-like protein n=1 Tax=Didymella heteroderae TaxID=1769908 RepID=A0A9P4WLK2_9PLEO|nr:hypothetical protein E8E12_004009 [Didymella heteroderae]